MRFDKDYFLKKNNYLVGSACTGIFIYISHLELKRTMILCPSNICYSIPFTIKHSGNSPLFFDVNKDSGNADSLSIFEKVNDTNNVSAIILPHMFGNKLKERNKIISFCRNRKIRIIEDLAGAFGISLYKNEVQSDAVVYSFGSNKHIDLGFGGILATDDIIVSEKLIIPVKNSIKMYKEKSILFEKLYKSLLYSKHFYLLKHLKVYNYFFQDAFIYDYSWKQKDMEKLKTKLLLFHDENKTRLDKVEYLNDRINFNKSHLKKYDFNEGSSPWRYNILILDKKFKKEILKNLLLKKLPVSIWYPPLDVLFDQDTNVNAEVFFNRIINLNIVGLSKKKMDLFIETLNNS